MEPVVDMPGQAPSRPFLDRLRDAAPRGLKAKIFKALVNSKAIGKWAMGRDGIVRSGGLRFDVSEGYEHRAAAIRLGLYERTERYMACNFYTGTRDVIELGASLGIISCELARLRKPGIRQVSVEPEPDLSARAERNLRLNGFDDVVVERAAISYGADAEVSFTSGRGLGGQISLEGEVSVRAITLSGLLDKYGFDEFDLVIDIEGAEEALFMNEHKALERCKRILIECDAGQLDGNSEPKIFTDLGFRPIYIHESCATFERIG